MLHNTLKTIGLALLCLLASPLIQAQVLDAKQESPNTMTQTVKGRIIDGDSKYPIPGVTVFIDAGGAKPLGAVTDDNGYFKVKNVPLGRQVIKISMIGYGARVVPNVLVTAGKEVVLDMSLEPSVSSTDVVEVTSKSIKSGPTEAKHDMSFVSSRGFNVEETMRFAGSRNDPGRMASNFAGVQMNNDGRNDIIIRGNSPLGMLWRLDGLDIPNPSHFGAAGATGGPVTILNNNVLAKSDFFTGAFPAGYGNANSGVFDLSMRSGNKDKYEFLGQIGFNGFEAGAEGPMDRNGKSSFLLNYRYSTLAVVNRLGFSVGTGAAVPYYQDLTFKFGWDIGKAGRIELFGLGGVSNITFKGSEADTTNLYSDSDQDLKYATNMGVVGLSYTHFFGPNTMGKLVLGTSGNSVTTSVDSLVKPQNTPVFFYGDNSWTVRNSARYYVSHKFNNQSSINAGIQFDQFRFRFRDSVLNYLPETQAGQPRQTFFRNLRDFSNEAFLTQAFAQYQYRFTDRLIANAGLHLLSLSQTGQTVVEPRSNVRYIINEDASLSFGYGLHSQQQPWSAYGANTRLADGSYVRTNEKIGFTQSQQFVLGYNQSLGSNLRLKAETYFQDIYNVPIESDPTSAFSMLNAGAGFGYIDTDSLVNKGIGRNLGLELTLERTFSNGYYFLVTGSLFDSKYKGADGVWRNTAFNSNWLVNALAGYEWKVTEKLALTFDTKLTTGGGRYYTPFDIARSQVERRGVEDENRAFQSRFEDYFRLDLKIGVRHNTGSITQEFFVDIQNITNRANPFQKQWSVSRGREITVPQLGLFPNVNYRITF